VCSNVAALEVRNNIERENEIKMQPTLMGMRWQLLREGICFKTNAIQLVLDTDTINIAESFARIIGVFIAPGTGKRQRRHSALGVP
jgi:acetone carboxylase gamma subunit